MAKKFREVRRALSNADWTKVRQAGSHETWRSPAGATSITVAGKDSDMAAHLAYLRDQGRPTPEPHTDAGRVAA